MSGLVLSLFPGIGLLDQAFEEAGFIAELRKPAFRDAEFQTEFGQRLGARLCEIGIEGHDRWFSLSKRRAQHLLFSRAKRHRGRMGL